MKAIVVKDLNDSQLDMLVNYLITNQYKWGFSILNKESITRGEVLYMDNNKFLTYSCLDSLKYHEKNNCKVVRFNELIQMKKTDLKPGMVTEYASGEKRLVVTINNELYLISRASFADVKSFNDDLTCTSNPDIDIVKIYLPREAASLNTLFECRNCIWERSKEVIVTMDEIAKKFGCDVSQLKIKKQ